MQALRREEKELERQKYISFGSCMNRPIIPHKPPTNRLAEFIAPPGDPKMSPLNYNVDNITRLANNHKKLPAGYGFSNKTGSRPDMFQNNGVPGPGAYAAVDETKLCRPKSMEAIASHKPFLVGASRFQKVKKNDCKVPPGSYEHTLNANRKVGWCGSFGGNPVNLPKVEFHSTISANTNKLLSNADARKYNRRLAYLKLYFDE